MASIYDVKPQFQNLLRPVAAKLVRAGCTANQVTVSAFFLSLLVGALIAIFPEKRWPLALLPAALFIRMALNALDGMMAREHGMASRLGAILNELGDVLSDAVLYLPLALRPGFPGKILVIVVLLAVISEMAGVLALQVGAPRRYDGPMGKSDRAFLFGALGLAFSLGASIGIWLTYAFSVVTILLLLTIFNRVRSALEANS